MYYFKGEKYLLGASMCTLSNNVFFPGPKLLYICARKFTVQFIKQFFFYLLTMISTNNEYFRQKTKNTMKNPGFYSYDGTKTSTHTRAPVFSPVFS